MHSVIIKILTVLVKREKWNKQEDRAEEREIKIKIKNKQRQGTKTEDTDKGQQTKTEDKRQ